MGGVAGAAVHVAQRSGHAHVGSDGLLSQTLATTPGAAYDISWFLASDAQAPIDFNVTWDGNTTFSQTNLAVPDWVQYTFTEFASTNSATITFGFRNDLGYLALDDTFGGAVEHRQCRTRARLLVALCPGGFRRAVLQEKRPSRRPEQVGTGDVGVISGR